MTVVEFPARDPQPQDSWSRIELQHLVALYSRHAALGEAAGWEVGCTDRADPQFYLLGADHDCMLCVSRLRQLYVLEDGSGGLVGEDQSLGPLLERASRLLARRRTASMVTRMLFMLAAIRMMIEEKLEPLLEESSDTLVRFAPQFAALI